MAHVIKKLFLIILLVGVVFITPRQVFAQSEEPTGSVAPSEEILEITEPTPEASVNPMEEVVGTSVPTPEETPEAVSSNEELDIPVICNSTKGIYKPTETMVIVPLDDVMFKLSGETSKDIAQKIFYEFAYVLGNGTSPLNAVLINNEVIDMSCTYQDFTTNITTDYSGGIFVLGTYGVISPSQLQEIIDTRNIKILKTASLIHTPTEKNTKIALSELQACGDYCKNITLSNKGLEAREYSISIDDPNYAKSVRQQEQLSFSIKVRNESEFPIYASSVGALQIRSKHIPSELYHSSWVSPEIIAVPSSIILPGAETVITSTMGAPLLPGKYSEKLLVMINGKQVTDPVTISFSVEKDNLTLGQIISKDGYTFANLRAKPTLIGIPIGKIDAGTYVIIKKIDGAWVKIETKEGTEGWVYKPYIREI